MMKKYESFDLLGYHWTVKPELAQTLKEKVIPSALSGESSPELRVIKRKFLRSSFIFSLDGSSPGIFVKVYKYDRASERIKTLLRASKAKAEWRMGRRMFGCGLPVAEPLGLGERRSRGVVTGCVLMLREIPYGVGLSGYIVREYRRRFSHASSVTEASPRPPDKEEGLLRSLGGLIRRMHSAGFSHPDLHAGNLLVDPGVVPPKLWLVDLHSVGRSSKISSRRRMESISHLPSLC